ncbi:MAG: 50S ribosomal protein L18 [Candidatus Micrarchaeota archaeon]|nr:50S ribosomal protein L18 [Candidatus Micrarchaeota archaeon]
MTKAKGPLFDVHFRRRRQGRTNYVKRLALLKSGLPRLVVRKLNKGVLVQLIQYSMTGDQTICQASSRDLEAFGFVGKRNVPSAYLTGFLLGKKAVAKGVTEVVADFGLHTVSKGGILFATVKGAIDAGIKTKLGEEMLPSQQRITGKHINTDISQALEKISTGAVNPVKTAKVKKV